MTVKLGQVDLDPFLSTVYIIHVMVSWTGQRPWLRPGCKILLDKVSLAIACSYWSSPTTNSTRRKKVIFIKWQDGVTPGQ